MRRLRTTSARLWRSPRVVLDRPDYCSGAGSPWPSLLWLLGPAGLARFEAQSASPPVAASRGFGDGGYYALRDGWSAESSLMIVDAGPHGSLAAGHAHADALSFDLTVAGAPLFVDPGTVSYVGAERERFRSTAVHNTAMVDGVSSSEPAGMFRWSRWARTTVDDLVHARVGGGAGGLARRLHPAPRSSGPLPHCPASCGAATGWCWTTSAPSVRTGSSYASRRPRASPASCGGPGGWPCPRRAGAGRRCRSACGWRRLAPWPCVPARSPACYGTSEEALAIDTAFERTGSTSVLSIIAAGAGADRLGLEGGPATGGWSWRIAGDGWVDTVALAAGGGEMSVAGFSVRGGFGWLRRDASGTPLAVVGLGGAAVAVDGMRLDPEGRVVVARWRDGLLRRDG